MQELKLENEVERIAVCYQSADHSRVVTVPFRVGMRLQRGGKVYEVDAKGTQRRVK
jgi:hypothetical protein